MSELRIGRSPYSPAFYAGHDAGGVFISRRVPDAGRFAVGLHSNAMHLAALTLEIGHLFEYLIVGGGGAGCSGGGGGGGVRAGVLRLTTTELVEVVDIVIGEGGVGGMSIRRSGFDEQATDGKASSFASISAAGGGGGGPADYDGRSGGSGGGGALHNEPGYTGDGGAGIDGQGNTGGSGGVWTSDAPFNGGGGGGGAGSGGGAGVGAGGGGGAGVASDIIERGTWVWYGGGGGGGLWRGGGYGGSASAGGGIGGSDAYEGQDGTDGLGGGGGGAGYAANFMAGGDGGKGVVILRHRTSLVTYAGGDTISEDDGDTVRIYTQSGVLALGETP